MPYDPKQFNGRTMCLPLGCRLETKEADQHWLAFDREDWKLLYGLLTKAIPVVSEPVYGTPVIGYTLPGASASHALEALAEFALIASKWCETNMPMPRPEGQGAGE